jgi:transcriptional regulator with XRE-family HTH domain
MSKSLVESVAHCVKRLRHERGISQEELAEQAGLDRTYISGIERAVRNISLNSLALIVQARFFTDFGQESSEVYFFSCCFGLDSRCQ